MLWLFRYYYGDLSEAEISRLCPPLMSDSEPYTASPCGHAPPLSQEDFLIVIDDFGVDVVDDSDSTIVEDSFDA